MPQCTPSTVIFRHQVPASEVSFVPPSADPGGATSDSTLDVSGYSFVEADSMEEALSFTKNHPHLNFPGATLEVHEVQPIPGM